MSGSIFLCAGVHGWPASSRTARLQESWRVPILSALLPIRPHPEQGSWLEVLSMLPLSHVYGITTGMNMAVALAGALVLVPTSRTDQVLQAMKRYQPTLFSGKPALYLAIANYPKVRRYGIATIRVCVSGSAPLPVEVQEAFEKLTRGQLVKAYALTEASPSPHANPHNGERRLGSIGLPSPSTDARTGHRQSA